MLIKNNTLGEPGSSVLKRVKFSAILICCLLWMNIRLIMTSLITANIGCGNDVAYILDKY